MNTLIPDAATLNACVEHLWAQDVRFIVQVPVPPNHGSGEHWMDRPSLLALLREPLATSARLHGVTVPQYQAWLESEGHVQCNAQTRQRRRCRNHAVGCCGIPWSAQEWVAHQGEYCAVHAEGPRH